MHSKLVLPKRMCQGEMANRKEVVTATTVEIFLSVISLIKKYRIGKVRMLKKKDGNLTVNFVSPKIFIRGTIK